jgi:hypothetical protein
VELEPLERAAIPLAHGNTLVVEPGADGSVLRLIAADGKQTIALRITAAGLELDFVGGLSLRTDGDLALSARRIDLNASEGMSLTTAGDLKTNGRSQTIVADLGDVKLKANDDVRVNGERVLVNC